MATKKSSSIKYMKYTNNPRDKWKRRPWRGLFNPLVLVPVRQTRFDDVLARRREEQRFIE